MALGLLKDLRGFIYCISSSCPLHENQIKIGQMRYMPLAAIVYVWVFCNDKGAVVQGRTKTVALRLSYSVLNLRSDT